MRKLLPMMDAWRFTDLDGAKNIVNLPHTWNNADGQDGGDDYRRGVGIYEKDFPCPDFDKEKQLVYLQFQGVNASATVTLNGHTFPTHHGGYSTFRFEITPYLQAENQLTVEADNSANDFVYPQKADFTFYGGIYREVSLLIVNKCHFALNYFGGKGLVITPDGKGKTRVQTYHNGETVSISLLDAGGNVVASGEGSDLTLQIENPHLWDGILDPYLYTCRAELFVHGEKVDEVTDRFGVRSFFVDPKKGFFLNGKPYPLHGVSRHQDRKGLGNALTREHHEEDMRLIQEMGANTIRLAHYQHDQFFYDLCDEAGMVVWAEIPYISEHLPKGRDNTLRQMTELIVQNYNHPSICVWGISNEITISTRDKKDMLDNHWVLNDLVHELDPSRPTVLACYAVCGPFNKVAHITDLVSWNLYLGWYVPGLFLNDLWIDFFHFCYPNRCLGFSEYGCEGMPNLHSAHPRRGDHTEEYQAIYHEYLLKCFSKRPFLWANHVWNMFDFAADARNQGGEPGMNHKGLVTFDRATKKDSFYLYKAWWTNAPMVHICAKRFAQRTEKQLFIKVYSNCDTVTLYANGKKIATKKGDKIFKFRVNWEGKTEIKAVAEGVSDTAVFEKVAEPNPSYKLNKKTAGGGNWVGS